MGVRRKPHPCSFRAMPRYATGRDSPLRGETTIRHIRRILSTTLHPRAAALARGPPPLTLPYGQGLP